ncbi:MAG: ORF6N domain-containing protein [Elusimicrobia bacterium]|nr:ORF6N domain-containing protein [Elusimicrobiota bacterium]
MQDYSQLQPIDHIERRIYLVRGHKVMLSTELAKLYRVEPRALVQAVKRNIKRFPDDFMFRLTLSEANSLRSQTVILKRGQHIKNPPYAFTEQGVAMLSSVLRGNRAIQVNVAIMRAFVRLREMISSNQDLARRLDGLEKKYNRRFRIVFDAIRNLMDPPEVPRRRIGFEIKKRQNKS